MKTTESVNRTYSETYGDEDRATAIERVCEKALARRTVLGQTSRQYWDWFV